MDAGIVPSEKVTSPDAPTSDRPAPIRTMVDEALKGLSRSLGRMYID